MKKNSRSNSSDHQFPENNEAPINFGDNKWLDNNTKYVSEIRTQDCKTNNNCHINNYANVVWFRGIKISSSCDLKKIKSVQILVNNNIILNVPFSLLLKLTQIITSDNYKIIDIPKEILFGNKCYDFPISALTVPVQFCIESDEIMNYTLILQYKSFASNINIKKLTCSINNYKEFDLKNSSDIVIKSKLSCIGLFIRTTKIESLCVRVGNLFEIVYNHDFKYSDGNILHSTDWSNKLLSVTNELLQCIPNSVRDIIHSYLLSDDILFDKYLYWIPFGNDASWKTAKTRLFNQIEYSDKIRKPLNKPKGFLESFFNQIFYKEDDEKKSNKINISLSFNKLHNVKIYVVTRHQYINIKNTGYILKLV